MYLGCSAVCADTHPISCCEQSRWDRCMFQGQKPLAVSFLPEAPQKAVQKRQKYVLWQKPWATVSLPKYHQSGETIGVISRERCDSDPDEVGSGEGNEWETDWMSVMDKFFQIFILFHMFICFNYVNWYKCQFLYADIYRTGGVL
jgi:hypothetical protein